MLRTLVILFLTAAAPALAAANDVFRSTIQPILETKCVSCHSHENRKGKLALDTFESTMKGGASGEVIVPGKPDDSELIYLVESDDADERMPQKDKPLKKSEIDALRAWVKAGAKWPKGLVLQDKKKTDLDWWSLKPLEKPAVPRLNAADAKWARTPIDAFIIAKMREKGLSPSPQADARTLVRRIYFDLIGLPPSSTNVEGFEISNLKSQIDQLLASPHYGERWARHWLDVVHYGDTHGYDKDKLRNNAWPYRDYVIRSFNNDKPYWRFVQEQLAGDALWPGTIDGMVGPGFIAAGPWDFIGHAEVPETKIDGKVARNIDRDNMVTNTMNTFCSLTIQCARCHDHKLDPVSMEDYYSLQTVFAAIDRADREFDSSPEVAKKRTELARRKSELEKQRDELNQRIVKLAGPELAKLNQQIEAIEKAAKNESTNRPEFGWHSKIESKPNVTKWVQVDLGKRTHIDSIVLVACHDTFNSIGAGFGFPVRFRIEATNDPTWKRKVIIANHTGADYTNPKVTPQTFLIEDKNVHARYIRVTATKLVNRLPRDYIFALGELQAITPNGENVAMNKTVTSLDNIHAPVRWRQSNLVDGYYYGINTTASADLVKLTRRRDTLLDQAMPDDVRTRYGKIKAELERIAAMPKPASRMKAYVGYVYKGKGSFRGRGGLGPREIRMLARGDVTKPGKLMSPGVVPFIGGAAHRFELPEKHDESERRVALAKWITRKDNPLTWRSIVNRVWQYHFGRGLVDSPNDFGRGGSMPTHPELLDWLAVEFRDSGQSMKKLHRMIMSSAVYLQASGQAPNDKRAAIDAGNTYLWRMNRRRLTAEEIRDSILTVTGKLDKTMGGPGYRDFVLELTAHSPHYEYHKHDANDHRTHRRAIYRFIVRSQPNPWMNTLDCADPSMSVPKRDETLTALQALALLNNRFMLAMSKNFAARLKVAGSDRAAQIKTAYRLTMGRKPTADEVKDMAAYADEFALENTCRLILNLNEFVFVD